MILKSKKLVFIIKGLILLIGTASKSNFLWGGRLVLGGGIKLRRMMLKRKTDPKTVKHTLCEPAQSKCTRTCQKRHFAQKFAGPISRGQRFVRACAVEMHMDMSEEAFCVEIYRGKFRTRIPASVLCELAQSKCTWTCHKRHFERKFTGCAVEMHMDMSGDAFFLGDLQGRCQTPQIPSRWNTRP